MLTILALACVKPDPEVADTAPVDVDDGTTEATDTGSEVDPTDDTAAADTSPPVDTSPPADTGDSGTVEKRTYACGWPTNDPGTIVATGAEPGDVITDLVTVDQCGDDVHLYDFYAVEEYHILFLLASW